MAENRFSSLINADISRFRRVGHSATQYVKSIDRSSFGIGNGGGQVLNNAGNLGGALGGVAGVASVIGAGVASAAFLAACAGPQVAIAGAVVGLVMMAQGAYSNRESAHKALSKYVWNLVDTERPAMYPDNQERLDDAADAALTLLDDGKNQIKLLHSKLSDASSAVTTFNIKVTNLYKEYIKEKTALAGMDSMNMSFSGNLSRNPVYDTARTVLEKKRKNLHELWESAVKPGGAVFEYVRRCAHMGNYLQAPYIVSLAMKEKHSPGAMRLAGVPSDYFEGTVLRRETSKLFAELEKGYDMFLIEVP